MQITSNSLDLWDQHGSHCWGLGSDRVCSLMFLCYLYCVGMYDHYVLLPLSSRFLHPSFSLFILSTLISSSLTNIFICRWRIQLCGPARMRGALHTPSHHEKSSKAKETRCVLNTLSLLYLFCRFLFFFLLFSFFFLFFSLFLSFLFFSF